METTVQQHLDAAKITSVRKKTILVIDDSADLLNFCSMMLEMDGYEVIAALGGHEAFSILNEVDKPDLILLDFQMENMSGLEFLKKLEKNRPEIIENVPVVFFTGMDKVPTSRAVGIIRKPFKNDDLLAAVESFIERGTSRSQLN